MMINKPFKLAGWSVAGLLSLGLLAQGWADSKTKQSTDALNIPAIKSPLAQKSLINGLTHAGSRIVAVGQRGHILISDDEGKTWLQSTIPVSSDLVAVQFPDASTGYAVGHDGIILKSTDGGLQWTVIRSGSDNQSLEDSYLDLWFDTADQGYVVGAFGKVLLTKDGGKSWVDMTTQVENPNSMHIYGIKRLSSDLYLAGEQGFFAHFNESTQRFQKLELPYKGSLFGLAGTDHSIWVYGLRGNLYRSVSKGQTWEAVPTQMSGALTASTLARNGDLIVVGMSSQLLQIQDKSSSTEPVINLIKLNQPAASVLSAGDGLLLGGLRGLSLNTPNHFSMRQGQ